VPGLSSANRGITVLGLLLLIIALMVAGFFVVRYLQSRQAATQSPPLVRPTMSVATS
jgi:flagellar biogenesis protein FliO